MKKEPALIVGGSTGAVTAVLAALVAFHVVALTAAQSTAVVGVIAAFAPVVAALITRLHVTPAPKPAPAPPAPQENAS